MSNPPLFDIQTLLRIFLFFCFKDLCIKVGRTRSLLMPSQVMLSFARNDDILRLLNFLRNLCVNIRLLH
jgi:hypothetical protein